MAAKKAVTILNLKYRHNVRITILNKYWVTAARILVTVNEMSLFNIFLVLLVKTECMMVSKMGVTWIKISYYMFY